MCWKCKKDIQIEGSVFRGDECPFCHADLHSCKNCNFYSRNSHYDCRETIDFPVSDKERANFCSHFSLKTLWANDSEVIDKASSAKAAFNALFS